MTSFRTMGSQNASPTFGMDLRSCQLRHRAVRLFVELLFIASLDSAPDEILQFTSYAALRPRISSPHRPRFTRWSELSTS